MLTLPNRIIPTTRDIAPIGTAVQQRMGADVKRSYWEGVPFGGTAGLFGPNVSPNSRNRHGSNTPDTFSSKEQ